MRKRVDQTLPSWVGGAREEVELAGNKEKNNGKGSGDKNQHIQKGGIAGE